MDIVKVSYMDRNKIRSNIQWKKMTILNWMDDAFIFIFWCRELVIFRTAVQGGFQLQVIGILIG